MLEISIDSNLVNWTEYIWKLNWVDADAASSAPTSKVQLIARARMQESSAPRIAEPNSGDLVSSPLSCSPFYFVKRYDASGPMTLEDECVTARLGNESSKMLDKSLHEIELEKDARANLDEVAANANVRLKSTIFFLSWNRQQKIYCFLYHFKLGHKASSGN